MRCPYCQNQRSRVIDTSHASKREIRRRRQCGNCGQRFTTYERPVLSLPLLIKHDGTREEFDREKLIRGLRIACAKRPISSSEIERIAGEIETKLQLLESSEVTSRVIGDLAMSALRELDHIAYVRYASVYLDFSDLEAIRDEIDRLLQE